MKVSSRGYGDAVRGHGHSKGAKVSLGRGTPTKREGSDGDLTLRNTNSGVILYAKYGGRWYSLHTGQPLIPGMIMMWSGQKHAIPHGWSLCDGNGGTPDLRAKFIIGAGAGNVDIFDTGAPTYATKTFGPDSTYASGTVTTFGKAGGDASGDAAQVTLDDGDTGSTAITTSQMPSHGHQLDGSNTTYQWLQTGSSYFVGLYSGSQVSGTGYTAGTDSLNTGGNQGHTHSHGDLTGKVTPGVDEVPIVDYYSLAFIMYVGSAADPGTEGYNQGGGDDGGSLGRDATGG